MKKRYEFNFGPNSVLKHGYTILTINDKSQAEIDTKNLALMALVDYFGGKEVVKKKEPEKKSTKKAGK